MDSQDAVNQAKRDSEHKVPSPNLGNQAAEVRAKYETERSYQDKLNSEKK